MEQEENRKQIRLTSAEIAQLWTQYLSDNASSCMLSYFLEKVEDEEIKPIIKHSLELSIAHIKKINEILTEEKNVVPKGFKLDEDVDLTAPRLYSDSYVLNFILQMTKIGLTTYGASVSATVRKDISNYYNECLMETMKLHEMTKDLLLEKGLYIRSPHLPNLENVEFVKKQGFVLDFFGEKRPLTAIEVSNLHANTLRNALGVATLIGFSQVAKSKEVTQFFLRGIEIAKNHIKSFGEKLEEDNLPVPMGWNSEVSESTVQVFSDKLMMYYVTTLNSLGIGYYGTSISQSPRVDLGVMYNKLSLEVQLYTEDGANIMIKNSWLEQPPLASDRDELVKKRK